MKPLTFNLILGCAVFLLQGCLLDPYPAELNTTLGDDYTKAIQEKKRCDYRLALDQPSSQYTVTGYKDNYLANAQPYTFPLGATLSSYMSQAQNGEKGDLITLHFHTTNFHFVLGQLYIAAVNSVHYQAHFKGPEAVGSISFPDFYLFTPAQAEEIDFPEKTFFAVSQALRSTTKKLFEKVTARLCPY